MAQGETNSFSYSVLFSLTGLLVSITPSNVVILFFFIFHCQNEGIAFMATETVMKVTETIRNLLESVVAMSQNLV